jgi:prepilin-type N-terminal cleavage/methylation domain-containing protein
MQSQKGFILIELIAVIVLVGIISAFTTFFLYSGVSGFLNIKNTTTGAANAQMSLDRISQELRTLNYLTAAPVTSGNASLSYQSEVLPGNRKLQYNAANDTIAINIDGTDYLLLDNVTSFSLSVAAEDLNQDGVDNVASIEVGFHLSNIGQEFKLKIFPRYMVKNKQ